MFLNNTYIKSFILNDISGHWAEPNIQYLADEGILMGYPDRSFHPNAPITRAEVAMILSQIQQSKFGTNSSPKPALKNYRDHDMIPDWAKEAIADVTAKSIMKGYSDNTFRPNQYLSRNEAFSMIGGSTKNQAKTAQDKNAVSEYITRAEFCTLILNS